MLEIIFEVLITILFGWLFFKVAGLAFRLTWGAAKIIGTVLLIIALPVLIACLVFAGGLALIFPVALIAGAFGILKSSS